MTQMIDCNLKHFIKPNSPLNKPLKDRTMISKYFDYFIVNAHNADKTVQVKDCSSGAPCIFPSKYYN